MSYDDYDQLGLKNITVFEDNEISPSTVLNVFGEPFIKFSPRQPMGFDLTKKKENYAGKTKGEEGFSV